MHLRYRTSGFTLIEVLVGVMLSGLILTAAYSSFQGIMKSEIRLGGVIDIQRNLFYLNEKLASLIHDGGTLDYEEYFNRRMLGYEQDFVPKNPDDLAQGSIYTFKTLSKYGNGNTKIYLCGKDSSTDPDACLGANAVYEASTTGGSFINLSTARALGQNPQQAYRQYRELGFNYAPNLPSPIRLPAIFPSDGPQPTSMVKINENGLPELYLIKKLPDGSYERTYFRHVYEEDPNYSYATNPCTPSVSKEYCIGKIQMTRLISCDNLDKSGASDKPDGTIDAWIPHEDFSKSGTPTLCSSINSGNIGAATDNLLWIDVSSPDMNIIKVSFLPSPLKIPSLMSGTGESEPKSPTIQMHIEVQLSESIQRRGLLDDASNTPRMLITTFDLADL